MKSRIDAAPPARAIRSSPAWSSVFHGALVWSGRFTTITKSTSFSSPARWCSSASGTSSPRPGRSISPTAPTSATGNRHVITASRTAR